MLSDIEISQNAKILQIEKIAKKLNLKKEDLNFYGKYIAKVEPKMAKNNHSKLILVTSINPTKAGNGKTTVSIGLGDAFTILKKKVCLALREPSLGPVFGMKGGATGGGFSQIVPMEEINLHFTGDFHAITSANNLLCSVIDNHIYFGNTLKINPNKIFFSRCLDVNDRALRDLTICSNKYSRKEHFNITAASEIMAIMCLATSLEDLKNRLDNIIVALDENDNPVYAKSLNATEAMAILLKNALKPNLVQTLGRTPALVHLGPFANIAHGANSVIATKTALNLADYVITEAGFGADLGAEKFIDFKCREINEKPACAVVVATIPALKLHGGASEENLNEENITAVKEGIKNLVWHIDVLKNVYNVPVVVTLNKYETDTINEISAVKNALKDKCEVIVNSVFTDGGKGAIILAKEVLKTIESNNKPLHFAYSYNESVEDKIRDIAKKVYGAKDIELSETAKEDIKTINKLKLDTLPIIMAKTQFSLSADKNLLNVPENFVLPIKNIEIRGGAGFLVAICGSMLLMPALPKKPVSEDMQIDSSGKIKGLF
ncbi:MAG: formate--tetrahydrofolate ligase [Clostridia bacterium]|nr:formate--tetrahydrofolate ligase [Clostridia bacterium]